MKEKHDEEMVGERWRQAVDYEGWYDVSDFGRVKRVMAGKGAIAGRILNPQLDGGGYSRVALYGDEGRHQFSVHRIVMAAFVGPCPDGKEVNHKDGDKSNNRLDNLEYMTRHENIAHAFNLGLRVLPCGEEHWCAKLTEKRVHEIMKFLGKETQRSIAARFGVSQTTIWRIANGLNWTHLKEEEEK